MTGRRILFWVVVTAIFGGACTAVLIAVLRVQPITIKGAVLSADADPQKQLPIGDVQITATTGSAVSSCKSDASGLFSLTLRRGLRRRQPVFLQFRHADYQSLELDEFIGDK